jgi:hypothetical protein
MVLGCLLAPVAAGCGKADSGSSHPDPEKVKQEAERLQQENRKMFKK